MRCPPGRCQSRGAEGQHLTTSEHCHVAHTVSSVTIHVLQISTGKGVVEFRRQLCEPTQHVGRPSPRLPRGSDWKSGWKGKGEDNKFEVGKLGGSKAGHATHPWKQSWLALNAYVKFGGFSRASYHQRELGMDTPWPLFWDWWLLLNSEMLKQQPPGNLEPPQLLNLVSTSSLWLLSGQFLLEASAFKMNLWIPQSNRCYVNKAMFSP